MLRKILVFLTFACSFNVVANDEIYGVNFELEIGKAYTFLAKEEKASAALIARKLIKQFPLKADPYLILGIVHLEANLHDLALSFLSKAEEYRQDLLYQEEAITIFKLKAEIYRIKNDLQLRIKYLNEIGNFASSREGAIYREGAAEAFFELGEINYRLGRWGNALDFFLKALKNDYPSPVLPYLYLAHYYSQFSQAEIDLHFRDYLPNNYQITPQKNDSFLFYYKIYRNLLAKQGNEFLRNEDYKIMHEGVRQYFMSLRN